MSQLLRASILLAAAFLAACSYPAEFSSPISDPGSASYDESLIGTWGALYEDGSAVTLTVTPGAEVFHEVAGTFTQYFGVDDEAYFVWLRWTASASVIDGETYFNSRLIDSGGFSKAEGKPGEINEDSHFIPHQKRGYWIVRANISEDERLILDILWEDDLDLTPRIVNCGVDCSFNVFDLLSEELVTMIREAEPGKLFTQRIILARIQDSYPPQEEE